MHRIASSWTIIQQATCSTSLSQIKRYVADPVWVICGSRALRRRRRGGVCLSGAKRRASCSPKNDCVEPLRSISLPHDGNNSQRTSTRVLHLIQSLARSASPAPRRVNGMFAASGRLPLTRGAKCVGNCAQFTCSPLRVSLPPPFVDHVGLPLPPPFPSLFSSGLQSYDRIPLSLALRLKKPVFSVHLSATATPPVLRLITMI